LVRPAPRVFFHPDRQFSQPPRTGPVKAGRIFRGHPKGLALIGPSTVASLMYRGSRPSPHRRKFKPVVLGQIHAAGNRVRRAEPAVAGGVGSQQAQEAAPNASKPPRYWRTEPLSAFGSQHASNDAVDGLRPVGPRQIFPAVALREHAMSPVCATLPVVAAATVATVTANGHTVGWFEAGKSTFPALRARSPVGAGDQARGQGEKPSRGRPLAAKSTRPLTARCARHNEASDGALGSTEAACWTTDAAGRHSTRTG
jgi:hypothetical protein